MSDIADIKTDVDAYCTYSRGYKKRAIAEKMFGTLAIFNDSLKGYFSTFFLFFYQRTANLHLESFFGHSSQRGHQRRPQS